MVGADGRFIKATTKAVDFTSASELSNAIDLEGYKVAGLSISAAWTAADLIIHAADTLAGTYGPVVGSAGGVIRITPVTAGNRMSFEEVSSVGQALGPWRFIKLRSTNTASTVAVLQAASRSLSIVLKGDA
jgi:hypothetical protein